MDRYVDNADHSAGNKVREQRENYGTLEERSENKKNETSMMCAFYSPCWAPGLLVAAGCRWLVEFGSGVL